MSIIKDYRRKYPELKFSFSDFLVKMDKTERKKLLPVILKHIEGMKLKKFVENYQKDFERTFFNRDFLKELEITTKLIEDGALDGVDFQNISYYDLVKINHDALLKKYEKRLEKQILIIHEDEDWKILAPLSPQASLLYGYQTRWCTASRIHHRQFYDYSQIGTLIYLINKKANEKYAIYKRKGDLKINSYDSMDQEMSYLNMDLSKDIFRKINKLLEKETTNNEILLRTNKSIEFIDIPGFSIKENEFNCYYKRENIKNDSNENLEKLFKGKNPPQLKLKITPVPSTETMLPNYKKNWKLYEILFVTPNSFKSWLRFLWGFDIFFKKIPIIKIILFIFVLSILIF
jgi:hypothetical protein